MFAMVNMPFLFSFKKCTYFLYFIYLLSSLLKRCSHTHIILRKYANWELYMTVPNQIRDKITHVGRQDHPHVPGKRPELSKEPSIW